MSLDWSTVKSLAIPEGDVRAVSIGGVEVWRKLPYDAEVEYLESTGTQYVDTGIIASFSANTTISMLFSWTQTTSSAGRTVISFCGANSVWNGGIAINMDSSGADNQPRGICGGQNFNGGYKSAGTIVQCTIAPGRFTVGQTVITKTSTNLGYIGTPIYVFALNRSGAIDDTTMPFMRLYACAIYNGGTIVRDYIPVRVGSGSSAVGYLYDRANPAGGPLGNGLYGNSGTGAFVVGPDAN